MVENTAGSAEFHKNLQAGLRSITTVVREMEAALVEREQEILLSMVALVAKQHLFMLGPPGTGKTYVSRLIGSAVGGSFFEILLSKFTEPSDVFGPVSVGKLIQAEKYERNIEGYLPTAQVAMLDEIFKASSAILNSLLTIINERVFDNGGQRIPVPLQTLFSASNELPQDASLEALYDRFLLRHEVLPVTRPGELLKPRPKPTAKLVHLDVVQLAASAIGLPDLVVNRMLSLKAAALKEGIVIGDRRFQQSASLVRAAALLGGRTLDAGPQDLWPLAYCYWHTPDQIATMRRLVAEASQAAPTAPAAPPPTRPSRKPTQITHPTPQQAAAAASTASNPPGTPEQTFKALQTKMMGSISDIATNADIHTWIDQLLGGSWGSAQQRQQLADWKNACKKHARAQGTSWLGPNP